MGLLAAAAFSGNDANAQQVYRIVGRGWPCHLFGQAAAETPRPRPTQRRWPLWAAQAAAADGFAALRTAPDAVNRYPVTLYTGTRLRSLRRGPRHAVRPGHSLHREDGHEQRRHRGPQAPGGRILALPFLTIGGQQLKGFSEVEWSQFLDAAGYPKTSQLPASYRQPACNAAGGRRSSRTGAGSRCRRHRPRHRRRSRRPPLQPAADKPGRHRF